MDFGLCLKTAHFWTTGPPLCHVTGWSNRLPRWNSWWGSPALSHGWVSQVSPGMSWGFYWFWLVVLTILKHMKVNGKDDIPYIMGNIKCLKPPTSNSFMHLYEAIWKSVAIKLEHLEVEICTLASTHEPFKESRKQTLTP
jgi:hypothetical protein